jgi:hypothetical protein
MTAFGRFKMFEHRRGKVNCAGENQFSYFVPVIVAEKAAVHQVLENFG